MSADPSQKICIDCPQCGKQLMVPTSALGKTGKCPGCQHMFPLQASAAPAASAAPPVVRKPPAAAPPLANANADPFGNLSGPDQGVQPMGQQPFGAPQSPLGAPQSPLGAPQAQLGAPQQFGQQPAFQQPNPGLQQPNTSQWAANPYASAQAPSAPKQRAKKKSSDDATPMGQIGFGILMMIGAIVWFVGGLMADIIFFYPPILFVLGLVSMITGFVGLGKR